MRRLAPTAVVLIAACGYGFSTRYVAQGGAERVHVRAFENLSTEPSLGAEVTAALRDELARRGAAGAEGAPAYIDGNVRATPPGPSSPNGATWRIAVEVRARLVVPGAPVVERTVRRETDFLSGVGGDALETEGRRALALRRVAADAAHELLSAFER
ncbi:MAG TPA: LPS assembly lipoprotein LptE [Anaeromyxobacter sp.]|nr:LPS assembly lipoprotein LptE [Anaeromyxobacter sp.]